MTEFGRLDPELAATRQAIQQQTDALDLSDIPRTRARLTEMAVAAERLLPPIEGVTVGERLVPGREGDPDVPVRIYQPTGHANALPALLWIHGGGYVVGSAARDDFPAKLLARDVGCVVVSVEYRLAPESPFPLPIEDCYAALKWLASHADELGVRKSRIAIGGASAGGGMAAGLALLARDRAEVDVAFQLLIYPMLDDRNTRPAGASLPDTILWTRGNNLIGWTSYLGRAPGGADTSCYAAPCRATDLSGLPAAYIAVGELDLFLDEDVEYARRLLASGVPAELHVYPGVYHGFNVFSPDTSVSRRFSAERDHVLRRALHR
jgi:acetyl esterase/lipase